MRSVGRRSLFRLGAAAMIAPGLPGLAWAADQSTLQGAGKSGIERYLLLQENALQQSRAALALKMPTAAPRVPVNLSDRILMWHEISLDTNALDYVPPLSQTPYHVQFGPHRSSRAMADVQLAVFEAVNAASPKFASYTGFTPPQPDWSVDAAVAQAAHDALVYLYPPQTDRLNALLISDLGSIRGSPARLRAGRLVGAAAFASVLAKLGNDNTSLPEPSIPQDYQPSHAVGEWDVDPISQLMVALGGNWGKVTPFTFTNPAAFRAPPPPPVGSTAYMAEFAATKSLGGDPRQGMSTVRTPEQTFIGKFWSYDATPGLCAPPRLYNQIARQLILARGVTAPVDLARFLAVINVGMADAGVSAWEAKYFYKFWRPVTAIREAAAPAGDPNWWPLGAQATNTGGPNITPPFPAYPSGHATFGGTLFEILRSYMPDATPFTFVSDEFNGINKDIYGYVRPLTPAHFTSLSDAEYSNAQSRIYIGVHWQADADQGIAQGRRVAHQVLSTFALPLADKD
jgi:membrane-associated phospholipid phosphatase